MSPVATPPEGWWCRVCGATVAVDATGVWTCPNGRDGSHVLAPFGVGRPGDPLPIVAAGEPTWEHFAERTVWARWAEAHGLDAARRTAILGELDAKVAAVAGTGFRVTPLGRADELSDELSFALDGGVWLKDETGNVGGSHKARHLFGILAHLVGAEVVGAARWQRARPELAIASCGNAAIAAATLAAAVGWPLRVFVPEWASGAVVDTLGRLGAVVERCPRRPTDPPGDPCVHRFREAVRAGAIPFSVQGTENAWCLDAARSLGWEIAAQAAAGGVAFEHVLAHTGGGAFGSSVFAGLLEGGLAPSMHVVQSDACAPFARAVERAAQLGLDGEEAAHGNELMTVWEPIGVTSATGILDDETYDWLSLLAPLRATAGRAVVVTEDDVRAAHELVRAHTPVRASATGTAGLAGVLALRRAGVIADSARVVIVISGVER